MATTLSEAEIKQDLANTRDDARRLWAIVENLREFIVNSGGENRAFLRPQLLHFEAMLSDAQALETRIEQHLNAAMGLTT